MQSANHPFCPAPVELWHVLRFKQTISIYRVEALDNTGTIFHALKRPPLYVSVRGTTVPLPTRPVTPNLVRSYSLGQQFRYSEYEIVIPENQEFAIYGHGKAHPIMLTYEENRLPGVELHQVFDPEVG